MMNEFSDAKAPFNAKATLIDAVSIATDTRYPPIANTEINPTANAAIRAGSSYFPGR
jgi:hypothetical protein